MGAKRQMPFQVRKERTGGKNTFDHSHPWVASFTMGALVPFLSIEVISGDLFRLRAELFMRFARMYLPIFSRVNYELSWFYVPNRILWTGQGNDSWEYFLYNDDSVPQPTFQHEPPPEGVNPTALVEYMGIPTNTFGGTSILLTPALLAYRLSGYLKIYDEWYRNDQIQDERWFRLASADNTAEFQSAFDTLSPYFFPLRRNWMRDYYTSATPEPQTGANIQVPLVNQDFLSPTDGLSYAGPYRIRYQSNDLPSSNDDLVVDNTNTEPGGMATGGSAFPVYLDIQETASTIRELRMAIMLTEFLERSMRAGDRYRDNEKAYWKVDPDPLMVDRPAYIGSQHGRIVVSEVMSMAETEEAAVGDYSGQALALGSTPTFKYFCREHGFIFGIISVYPDTMYQSGLHRSWTRSSRYEYMWEQFALVGDDAILGAEVNFNYEDDPVKQEYNSRVWGYIPKYSEYRWSNGIIAGQMRDAFISFHFGRKFNSGGTGSEIELNDEFIQCIPAKTRVFQVDTNEDECYAYLWNDVQVTRLLPKFGIPVT